jgi:hypothetical protein
MVKTDLIFHHLQYLHLVTVQIGTSNIRMDLIRSPSLLVLRYK